MKTGWWFALATMIALMLGAPAAQGAMYCVNGPCPSGGIAQPSLQAGLDDAAGTTGRDRIEIGEGDLVATNATVALGTAVDIVGAGQGRTTVIGAAGNSNAVLTVQEPDATVSGLTIQLPTGGPAQDRRGLNLFKGSATGITVEPGPGGVVAGQGANLGGGASLTSSRVLLANSPSNFAMSAFALPGETATFEDVEVTGGSALGTGFNDGTVNARRLNVHDSSQGVQAGGTGVLNLSSSLIRVTGGAVPRAMTATTSFGPSPVLNARHVTAIGDGSADSAGGDASAAVAGRSATLNLRDTVIRDFGHPLNRTASAGTATLSVSYSVFPTAGSVDSNTAGTGATTPGPGNADVDPAFANPGAGDYRLRADSPLVDAGDPAPLGALDSPTDLGGLPRVADGNGVARSDIGAHEYQRPGAPAVAPLPGPAGDTTRPVLSAPSLSRTAFRTGAKSTPVGARRKRAPRGTTVRFRLSEPAAVRLAIERRTIGRRITRRGKRVCARRTRSNRSRRPCVRYTGIRTLVRRGRTGRNAVSFTGRIRGRALAPGRYRMRLVATDAAGNRSAPRTLAFRIVR